jgi:hypothetical protein
MKTTKEIAEHVGNHFKYGTDVRLAIENLTLPVLIDPADPPDDATKTQIRKWEKAVDESVKRENYLTENLKTVYSLVWGQCTDVMRQKVEATKDFKTLSSTADGLGLLRSIKDLVYNFQSQKYLPQALHESTLRFYFCRQGKHMTTQAYLEMFQNTVDVIEHSGGMIGNHPGIVKMIMKKKGLTTMTEDERDDIEVEAQEMYLAAALLMNADRTRYASFIQDLENDYLQGQDNYPKTVEQAYNVLTNWRKDPNSATRFIANDGVSFANVEGGAEDEDEAIALATDGNEEKKKKTPNNPAYSHITCHRCQQKGHYANTCDNP